MKTRKVEFTPPEGVVPEGTQAGEEFDMVSTFRVKGNGVICLVQVGDVKMPGYSQDTHSDAYAGEARNMMSMGGSSEGA